jgi:hypothetical protein
MEDNFLSFFSFNNAIHDQVLLPDILKRLAQETCPQNIKVLLLKDKIGKDSFLRAKKIGQVLVSSGDEGLSEINPSPVKRHILSTSS